MKRAYVGNIPFQLTEEDLREWFKPYAVTDVQIVKHSVTRKSRGFAFVEFATAEEFEKSLSTHHDRSIDGRKIVVNDATEKRPRSRQNQ